MFNVFLTLLLLAVTGSASATTRYVWQDSPSPGPPFTNWTSSAHVIEDAVDAAQTGDEIVVTNGTYATGGRAVGTNLLVSRVAVDKPVTVRSVNGPTNTIIQGYQVPGVTNGDGAIRCVYLASGASLSGFTLTSGATRADGDFSLEQNGGGAYGGTLYNCTLTGNSAFGGGGGAGWSTLNNCTLTGNSASRGGGAAWCTLNICTLTGNSAFHGGGAAWSTLNNSTLTSNSATSHGGGAYGGTLNNCTLTGNSAWDGGGAYYGTLTNCTLTGNHATGTNSWDGGGGACESTLNNCIVFFNTATTNGANYDSSSTLNFCCTTPSAGVGNITNAPLFVDYDGGNLRLQSNSPCINTGLNDYAVGSTDLDGRPRIVGGTVDMGAYEFQPGVSGLFIGWLQHYGLPTDGSADATDLDGDGHNNWQEWRCQTDPTNALSALRLLSASPAGTNVIVSWESVAGVNYFLERSTNLAASPVFTPLATGIPGQSGTTSYTDTNAAPLAPLFYRVGVP